MLNILKKIIELLPDSLEKENLSTSLSDVKFSQLQNLPSPQPADITAVVQSGTSYQQTRTQDLTYINANAQISEFQVTNLETDLSNKLNLSGGTMIGELILASDPVNPLDAATKEYVDTAVAEVPVPTWQEIQNGDSSGSFSVVFPKAFNINSFGGSSIFNATNYARFRGFNYQQLIIEDFTISPTQAGALLISDDVSPHTITLVEGGFGDDYDAQFFLLTQDVNPLILSVPSFCTVNGISGTVISSITIPAGNIYAVLVRTGYATYSLFFSTQLLTSNDDTIAITSSSDLSAAPVLDLLVPGDNITITPGTGNTKIISATTSTPTTEGAQLVFSLEMPVTTTWSGLGASQVIPLSPAGVSANGFSVDANGKITCLIQGNYSISYSMQSRSSGGTNGFGYFLRKNGVDIIYSNQSSTQTNQNATQIVTFQTSLNINDTVQLSVSNLSAPYNVSLITTTCVCQVVPLANPLVPNVSGSVWPPTYTLDTNITSVATIAANYTKIGGIVRCMLTIQIVMTGAPATLGISLPVAPNFTSTSQGQGGCLSFSDTSTPSILDGCVDSVSSDPVNQILNVVLRPAISGTKNISLMLSYEVQS